MNTSFPKWAILSMLVAVLGCGRGGAGTAFVEMPIYGTITLDGLPLAGAIVNFVSLDRAGTLMGLTSSDGAYRLQAVAKPPATHQGRFRVTVSKPVRRDGSLLAPDEPPLEHPGREAVPPRYLLSAFTPLEATVGEQGGRFDFALVSQ